ncbi:MAG TPA: T9SS type A sorting domain-containing protein [Brumimicrobium sp.]|nr:T9SS type A sorting domain-containing protein [Brumimicrobium sp.]
MQLLLKTIPALIFCLSLSFLSSHVIGQQNVSDQKTVGQGTLAFFLTDSENGYGVQGGVSFKGSKESFELSTDEGGRLEYSGKPGKYDITIFADGYDPLDTYFTIEDGGYLNIEAIIERSDRSFIELKNYSSPVVEGYVINPKTGKPLAGVTAQLIKEGLNVTTDSKGYFSMKPSEFSSLQSVEDIPVRSNFTFSKEGFMSHTIERLLMIPDKITLKIYLEEGQGENFEKYHQNVLDGTEKDAEMYEHSLSQEEERNFESERNLSRSSCTTLGSVRVGITCNCTNCGGVRVMTLQYYSESGLDDEWISGWNMESLKAGSIPYRTYAAYYANNPVKNNFDIASSTCNQVWGSTVYSRTKSAAQATAGKILVKNGTRPVRSEYSAENNWGGRVHNCRNGFAGGSGAYSCFSDNICSGQTANGHGRGMCQWGSQRWANTKSYTWIINHYYVNTVGYSLCGQPSDPPTPPTPAPSNLKVSQIPACNNGATFSWTTSANNWTLQVSTNANFSNSSIKTISSGTSTTVPSGFSPAINWRPNTTYYWRIYNGKVYKSGPSFSFAKCDVTPPTTSFTIPGGPNSWKTTDFPVSFTDADESGGSGVAKSFYQILYHDGSAWKANPRRGFFSDNFDGTAIDSTWTAHTGTWGISANNRLEQTDDTEGNSNIYASLDQNLSNRYLYTWNAKISGTGQSKRGGFHFFCDNPSQFERGDSYVAIFRTGGNTNPNVSNKVQIYKSTGNVLTLKKTVDYTINADQWYYYKLIYDRVTGELFIYINDNKVLTWTDPDPIFNGNSVSFRNGNSTYKVDNFKAYRTRYPDVDVTVGPGTNTDVPFQNSAPNSPAAKVKSIVMDNAGNLSEIAQEFVNIDWTRPRDLIVNDGSGSDIDTVYSSTLEGNWGTANDPNSGITEYKVAIGTSSGSDDILGWTSNGTNTSISNALSGLVFNQIYYITVKAKNGAGLTHTVSSDGQKYIDGNLSVKDDVLKQIEMFPNPTVNEVQFNNLDVETELLIYDMAGQLVLKTKVNPNANKVDVSNFAKGSYNVMIKINNQFVVKKLIKN